MTKDQYLLVSNVDVFIYSRMKRWLAVKIVSCAYELIINHVNPPNMWLMLYRSTDKKGSKLFQSAIDLFQKIPCDQLCSEGQAMKIYFIFLGFLPFFSLGLEDEEKLYRAMPLQLRRDGCTDDNMHQMWALSQSILLHLSFNDFQTGKLTYNTIRS